MFLKIPLSAADIATVDPNCVKTVLANDELVFNNVQRRLPRNPPDWNVLDSLFLIILY